MYEDDYDADEVLMENDDVAFDVEDYPADETEELDFHNSFIDRYGELTSDMTDSEDLWE